MDSPGGGTLVETPGKNDVWGQGTSAEGTHTSFN